MSMMIRTDWNFLMGQDAGTTPSAAPAPASAPAPAASGDAAAPAGAPATGDAKPATGTDAKAGTTTGEASKEIAPAAGGPKPQSQGGGWTDMLPMLAILGVMMIILFILPARARKKQQKKFDEMYSSLKRGDRIMLQNGKFVTVERVADDSIFVWADDEKQVREEYHKNSVASLESEVKNRKDSKKA